MIGCKKNHTFSANKKTVFILSPISLNHAFIVILFSCASFLFSELEPSFPFGFRQWRSLADRKLFGIYWPNKLQVRTISLATSFV